MPERYCFICGDMQASRLVRVGQPHLYAGRLWQNYRVHFRPCGHTEFTTRLAAGEEDRPQRQREEGQGAGRPEDEGGRAMTHEYEVVCRSALAEARATRRATYVIVWIDERVTWQPTLDQMTRLFARRITRITPNGQRTVETGRLRVP